VVLYARNLLKTKSKTTLALESLGKIISEQKASGSYFLPAERQLCEQIGLSRVTVRRALAILEERGVLIAGKNGRQITDNDTTEQKSCIWYLTLGRSRILLPARYRLWNNLQREATSRGFETKLVLYDMDNIPDIASLMKKDDFLVITENSRNSLSVLLENKKIKNQAIGIDASLEKSLKYIVMMDDYSAGYQAGEKLLKAGYKNPGFLGLDNGSIAFKERARGFTDALKSAGIEPACIKWLNANSMKFEIKKLVNNLEHYIIPGQDSLFLFSDEIINLIYYLIGEQNVPDKFGLITVNGSGNSVAHYPPITAIGHASGRTATTILNLIDDINQGRFPDKTVIKVKPSIHEGVTIKS